MASPCNRRVGARLICQRRMTSLEPGGRVLVVAEIGTIRDLACCPRLEVLTPRGAGPVGRPALAKRTPFDRSSRRMLAGSTGHRLGLCVESQTPTFRLWLTAAREEADRFSPRERSDDYLTKPFGIREFVAPSARCCAGPSRRPGHSPPMCRRLTVSRAAHAPWTIAGFESPRLVRSAVSSRAIAHRLIRDALMQRCGGTTPHPGGSVDTCTSGRRRSRKKIFRPRFVLTVLARDTDRRVLILSCTEPVLAHHVGFLALLASCARAGPFFRGSRIFSSSRPRRLGLAGRSRRKVARSSASPRRLEDFVPAFSAFLRFSSRRARDVSAVETAPGLPPESAERAIAAAQRSGSRDGTRAAIGRGGPSIPLNSRPSRSVGWGIVAVPANPPPVVVAPRVGPTLTVSGWVVALARR